jgi:hypothetical protein
VDWLTNWFEQQTSTPTGSILLFILVFVTRLAIDQYQRSRAAKKHAKRHKLNG